MLKVMLHLMSKDLKPHIKRISYADECDGKFAVKLEVEYDDENVDDELKGMPNIVIMTAVLYVNGERCHI